MSQDPTYFAMRAIEERRLAMAAADQKVRRVHLEMAAKYALLAGSGAGPIHEISSDAERRTA